MGGGGGFGIPIGGGGLGIGTVVVLGLVGWALGIDPRLLIGGAELLSGGGQAQSYQTDRRSAPAKTGAPQDEIGGFVSRILGSTEVEWKEIFAKDGKTYRAPTLVHVPRRHRCALRRGAGGDGAVLLPGRPEDLSRYLVLPRDPVPLPRLRRQGLPVRRRPM